MFSAIEYYNQSTFNCATNGLIHLFYANNFYFIWIIRLFFYLLKKGVELHFCNQSKKKLFLCWTHLNWYISSNLHFWFDLWLFGLVYLTCFFIVIKITKIKTCSYLICVSLFQYLYNQMNFLFLLLFWIKLIIWIKWWECVIAAVILISP